MKQYLVIITVLMVFAVLNSQARAAGARPPGGRLTSRKFAVRVSAVISEDPPQITLTWPTEECYSYVIYRRFLDDKQWLTFPSAVLDGKATSWVDKKIKTGIAYEYRIDRQGRNYIGRGYIVAGIKVPLQDRRGKVILLVDRSVASSLAKELARLEHDLAGDGWEVIRRDVARDGKVTDVKKFIVREYRKDPKQVNTVFIFGHVPIPYSGNLNPDGHKNHVGAWPADLYYGDIDGKWTDRKKHKYYPRANQANDPGDGKFDQSSVPPDSIELAVGRVDLSDMPAFGENEIELLRRYLNKDHYFRHGQIRTLARGLVDDNFGSFRGEAFGSSAWRNFAAFFGADKVNALDFIPTLAEKNYLWAYGCGGGSPRSAGGIGVTEDMVSRPPRAIFTMLFGSYFGDWNWKNNFMRAPLAAAGYSLTCAWDGRPHWYFQHMAMGRTIGYSTLRTQNNYPPLDYHICNEAKSYVSGKDDDSEWEFNPVHVALMGDPTLRMHPVPPPQYLNAAREGDELVLRWSPKLGVGIVGYHVYAAGSLAGPFERLTRNMLDRNEYRVKPDKQARVFQVRSVALTTSASGSYFNSSQGVYVMLSRGQKHYRVLEAGNMDLTTSEDTPIRFELPAARGTGNVKLWSSPCPPAHGRVHVDKNGGYVYTPAADYNGTDEFRFFAWDGLNDGRPVRVRITVKAVPDPPRALSRKYCLVDGRPFAITLRASDPDDLKQKLAYTIIRKPVHGRLSGDMPKLTYTPAVLPKVPDMFTFTANDGKLTSKPATITLLPPYHCPAVRGPKKIDGNLDDWAKLPLVNHEPGAFAIDGKKAWQGEKDNLFSIGVAYDKDYLYIAVRVIDDQRKAIRDKLPWQQDGIEVRIDARPAARRSAGRGRNEMKDFLLFALTPSPEPDKPWLYRTKQKLPDGCRYVCVRTREGFNTKIAVPTAYLDRMAKTGWQGFRLNVCVDDLDDDGLVQIWWKPDWRRKGNYWGSGSFVR